MRTSSVSCTVVVAAALGLGPALGPAVAFDGTTSPASAPVITSPDVARAISRSVPVENDRTKALTSLQYAADQGHPAAQWKLGRMYANGDGVPQDNLRAFNYFSQIANSYPDESPGTPQGRIVANAFVALGQYYLDGIPNTRITANALRAREMFAYAASYFGDAQAQYYLGRLYLEGNGAAREPRQAARWLQLAATKGHCQAQVLLGDMLFRGEDVPRQAARGLMWLTLGRDCVGRDDAWIKPLYDSAFHRASDDERAMALVYLESWLKERRD